jgi:DNA polymerase kappa
MANEHNQIGFHFTNNKAGMDGLDRKEIDKIIYETTKDSPITKKKEEELVQLKLQNTEYTAKLNSLYKSDILVNQMKNDALNKIKEIRLKRDTSKLWMHLDMDMFYAAVEIRDNPSLADKPVAVGDKSMVSTSNYVARKYGVRSAMPGFIAIKLCSNLIFVKPDFRKYSVNSNNL